MAKSKKKTKVSDKKSLNKSYEETIDSVIKGYNDCIGNGKQMNTTPRESKRKQKQNRQTSEADIQFPISQENHLSGAGLVNRPDKPRSREPELTLNESSKTVPNNIGTSSDEESDRFFYNGAQCGAESEIKLS
jgi:hypothetical protein